MTDMDMMDKMEGMMEEMKDDEEKKLMMEKEPDSKMGDMDEKEDDETDLVATCPEKYEGEQIIWDLNKLKNENEGRATKD